MTALDQLAPAADPKTNGHAVTNGEPRLLLHHRKHLRDSGLTDETIRRAGIYSNADPKRIAAMLNINRVAKDTGPCIVFPYLNLDGRHDYYRLRPDIPRQNGKKVRKYEAPRKLGNRVYIPPGVLEHFDKPETELLITEGEKKALAATQAGFHCLGLAGVWCFSKRKSTKLLAELDAVNWQGRVVRIVFDDDVTTNPDVKEAEMRLAALLAARGAKVRCARLPSVCGEGKTGLDDFLLHHADAGRTELRKVLDAAERADVPKSKEKNTTGDTDAIIPAKDFLRVNGTKGEYPSLYYWRDQWWGFHRGRYKVAPDHDIRALVHEFCNRTLDGVDPGYIRKVLAHMQAMRIILADAEQPRWMGPKEARADYLTVANGMLKLDEVLAGKPKLHQHSALWFSPFAIGTKYEADADCPKWMAFLSRNLEDDAERIALLQEWFGYCLTHDTRFQRFLIAVGEGANGKSVACAALTALLGIDNVSHVPLEEFGGRFALYRTYGKTANICAEIGETDRVSEGQLKQFTSGDRMQFEVKFKSPIEAIPTAKLTFATNNLPRFSDRSGGLWRRLMIVPFDVVIQPGERIAGMDKPHWWANTGELPGILNWALAGLVRLRQQGEFTKSSRCEDAIKQHRVDCNPAGDFLTDYYECSALPDAFVEMQEIYKQYKSWCEDNGFSPLNSANLAKELKRKFPFAERRRRTIGSTREWGYEGIGRRQDF